MLLLKIINCDYIFLNKLLVKYVLLNQTKLLCVYTFPLEKKKYVTPGRNDRRTHIPLGKYCLGHSK